MFHHIAQLHQLLPASSAKSPSAQAEKCRQWNDQNHSQTNPGARPAPCKNYSCKITIHFGSFFFNIARFQAPCVPGSVLGTISRRTSILSWPPVSLFFDWKAAISMLWAFTPAPSFFLLRYKISSLDRKDNFLQFLQGGPSCRTDL